MTTNTKVYSKDTLLKKLKTALLKGNSNLYSDDLINRNGCFEVGGKKIPYTEEIIKQLYDREIIIYDAILNDIDEINREKSYYTLTHEKEIIEHKTCLNEIRQIYRKNKSYYTKSHENKLLYKRTKGSNRDEENYVKDLFIVNPFVETLGKPIDFQTPLKGCKYDKAGKIDLLMYNEKTAELFIVEVKKAGSHETALRCCLEVQTYLQQVDLLKLIKDFQEKEKLPQKDFKVKLAIIVFENSNPANEFKDKTRTYLQKLVNDFDITVCYDNETEYKTRM